MSDATPIDDAFATALAARDFARAEALLRRGARVDRERRYEELFDRLIKEETSTYLMDAAARGDVETVRFLLDRGADPNVRAAYSGNTALHRATYARRPDVVQVLLARGADPDAEDDWNAHQTALDVATTQVLPAVVGSLLAGGARPTFRRLNFSVDGGASAREVIRLLVAHGADVNEVDPWGRTPLMGAAESAEPETVQYLIGLGADVNRATGPNMNGYNDHRTPLDFARAQRRDDVAALLVAHGARRGRPDARGCAPLLGRLWSALGG